MSNELTLSPDAAHLFGELKKNWGWLLALGILFVVLGMIGLGMTFTVTVASVVFFGVLLLLGGGAQLVEAFKGKGWKGTVWHVLIGLLYLVAGVVTIQNPVGASVALTLILAWIIIGIGLLRIILAVQHRAATGWGWSLAGGIVTLLLGMMILARWPQSGLWIIGLFVAIELISNGWSSIFIALAAREAGRVSPAPATT